MYLGSFLAPPTILLLLAVFKNEDCAGSHPFVVGDKCTLYHVQPNCILADT
ncbi:hypothetical protein PF005_g24546 [Phytophthora fragariae]|uniref:Uncharacterized protein n=1 Tax=Phytophthora fragariae TaxID=53985 RepID=A0A6A4C5X5_9STRA|nr:hypothetical protein PF003_g21095 [Phytophthora fragariae]KAE8949790.1 hypothetical protein PF009_g705 [Phytophthora fragariae]KAE8971553.1 hypothetical protein PF011_g25992 [Phytophthora fragariae]KAE9070471.1 hypothetical protein PF010_g26257 [Phytophthora fragariae]KAE9086766.1 hypothetical protein PF006_g25955 [Phytophthora fragariae]